MEHALKQKTKKDSTLNEENWQRCGMASTGSSVGECLQVGRDGAREENWQGSITGKLHPLDVEESISVKPLLFQLCSPRPPRGEAEGDTRRPPRGEAEGDTRRCRDVSQSSPLRSLTAATPPPDSYGQVSPCPLLVDA